jgi:Tfp pilus assembly protein PilN
VSPLLGEVKRVDGQVTEIKKVINQQNSQQNLLKYILSQFPASVNLSQLLLDSDKLNLIGFSSNPKDIQLFYSKLKKDGKFASVNFSEIRKNELNYSFTLELSGFKN